VASRNGTGEGSLYQRADGRWAGSAFVWLTDGRRKRVHVYAATRREAHDKLTEILNQDRRGIRTPANAWTVADYLDHWLGNAAKVKIRPRTHELYEGIIRLHLKPVIGHIKLRELTIGDVQQMLNALLPKESTAYVHRIRGVLRAALSRAEREELIFRNVAKLVDLPPERRKPITPWTAEQSTRFLAAARSHRWYGAYLLILAYGTRRGETLGLRWRDVNFEAGTIRIEQQLQRIGKELHTGPVKTEAGRRLLPMIAPLRDVLLELHAGRPDSVAVPPYAADDEGMRDLVFLSSTNTPIDPKNFARGFKEIAASAELPEITVHHTRHTAATTLKNMGVPARDAQLILGHSHITTTQQLYQHGDIEGQTKALARVGELLTETTAVKTAVKTELSTGESTIFRALTPGGPAGDRTPDTLLKRVMLTLDSGTATPVSNRCLSSAHKHILGFGAVKTAVKTYAADTLPQRIVDSLLIAQAVRNARTERLRLQSFPLNLLPPRHISAEGDDNAHTAGVAA